MSTTDSRITATAALMGINESLDALLPAVRTTLQRDDMVTVAGDLTALLLKNGSFYATSIAVAAVLRLADQQ